ncbi:hypothetical protein BDV93DRAFT_256079 [Ceratobasidium sp. AG-I]|nr:hypothetical protein BDV93DRAFT_256079 [Ceratobasidium sp. AG-I]
MAILRNHILIYFLLGSLLHSSMCQAYLRMPPSLIPRFVESFKLLAHENSQTITLPHFIGSCCLQSSVCGMCVVSGGRFTWSRHVVKWPKWTPRIRSKHHL